jgi:uncharacterized coiled-coil protein SlyX
MYRNSKEDLKICNEMANNTRNNFQSSKIPLSLEMAIYWIKFVQEFRLIDILQDNKKFKQRIKEFEERLQISPYGDDKIDELEECIGYKDYEIKQLKQQIESWIKIVQELKDDNNRLKYQIKIH